MESLLVGFLVKLFDIPGAVVGLVAGWFARTWWQMIVAAFIGGSFGEVVLYLRQDAREFDITVWLVGVVACFAWAALSRGIKAVLRRSN